MPHSLHLYSISVYIYSSLCLFVHLFVAFYLAYRVRECICWENRI